VEGGQGPFHYLWFKDHLPIPGATNPELTFDSLRASDSGTYWVTVFNDRCFRFVPDNRASWQMCRSWVRPATG
jgi:hypothetical protein